ncbi:uncharacterized protein N7500_003863 [Penicillium coprophilum]|uniref:uncharacterized protein n=1 Tax=Penicillium coprophilum TaxID=36646 RepID=UPI0023A619CA|nr:uncharacterized protein N7500_003863 [Penicillium coprophilum]KAJ5171080.1 hypothetical protein N7500_003863 [Penicillium coprophilum]
MPSSRVMTRPPEFCPNCASYLTIAPRPTGSARRFRNYFTCRACPYICPVSENESSGDESSGNEAAGNNTADDERAANESAVKPVTKKPAVKEPAAKEPVTKKPAVKGTLQ